MGTENIGACISGMRVCAPDGMSFGPCMGEVIPQAENCATPADDDCLGMPDCGDHVWSKRFGDGSSQNGQGVTIDPMGNVLLVGYFQGTIDFGGGTLTSAGSNDVYVAKLAPDGTHIWSKRFGDAVDQRGQALGIDAAGNIYVSGWFAGTINFGGNALTSAGGEDSFLVKLSPDGTHIWSKRFGAANTQRIKDLAIDPAGGVVVTGDFLGSIDLGGGALTSAGGVDIFLAKLNADGTHVWSQRFGTAGDQLGNAVRVGAGGNVVLIGDFNGNLDVGSGAMTSAGGTDIYVASFGAQGTAQWSRSFGNASNQHSETVGIDSTGNIVFSGYLEGSADFGGGMLNSAGGRDHYLTKLAATGAHVWSKRFGEALDQETQNLALDKNDNIVFTGYLNGTTNYGGGPLTSAGMADIVVVKLSTAGDHVWSKRYGDAGGQSGQNVAVDAAGYVYVCGDYGGVVDFGGGPLTSANNSLDIFVAKLAP